MIRQIGRNGNCSGNRNHRAHKRTGAAMIMMVVCIIGLFGLLALAIEIGVVAIARSQAQNAADSAAMAGARSINGNADDNYGLDNVPTKAANAVAQNQILGSLINAPASGLAASGTDTYVTGSAKIQIGSYEYTYNDTNTSSESFGSSFPRVDDTSPYSAIRAIVTGSANLNFARVFGLSSKSVTATSVSVHRPRDIFIIMDLSRSMRFQSLISIPESGSRTTSMNPDPDYPRFGHYSDTSGAALYGNTSYATGGGELNDPANIAYSSNSGSPIVEDFYANAVGVTPSSSNRAFTRANATKATTPGGDNYLKTPSGSTLNAGNNYVHTLNEFNNGSSTVNTAFELTGYANWQTWNGYTEGPSYYGKSFFIWPPNPGFGTPGNWAAPSGIGDTSYKWHTWADSYPRDWRQRFFVAVNTDNSNSPGVIQHNTILFNTDGTLRTPNTTVDVTENGVTTVTYKYYINYAAILYWLTQSPSPFPATIQAGRIRYYSAIPDGTDTALNNRFWTTQPQNMTNNERFWKAYIDYVLGFESSSASTANGYSDISARMGVGDFYTYNGSTVAVNNRTDRPSSNYINLSRNPTSGYTSNAVTGPWQTTTTSYYQTANVNANKTIGALSVPLGSPTLTSAPVANTNRVMFGSGSSVYLITNSATNSVSILPALIANVNSGTTAKVYSSNNASGATAVSVATLPVATTANADVIGFNQQTPTGQLYTTSNSSQTKLSLNSGLNSGVNMNGDSVEVYGSTNDAGSTRISVVCPGLTNPPTINRDYMIINGDTAHPYLITGSQAGNNDGFLLTISPGLDSAVNLRDVPVKIYSPYMPYSDDVKRPKHHFWFGGMTFVDWLGNLDTQLWWPGNCHEAQAWACKVGIQTAIDDIKNNHPNDFIGMTFFSNPKTSRTGTGYHNRAIVALGRNYQQLKDSLWFPPTTVTGTATEITPYDADMDSVPRANGSTAPGMGFMIAYNQLSNSAENLRTYALPSDTYRGNAGGLGRKGSQRIVIFETDGVPNTQGYKAIISDGADSYYPIRIKNPGTITSTDNVEWPNAESYNVNNVYGVVQQIVALDTATIPGHSTVRRPALVYPIGYGSLFDANNPSANQTNALNFMQTVAYHGNTATNTTGSNFSDTFRIYGTNSQRITRMQTAFTKIMQTGTQVTLIE